MTRSQVAKAQTIERKLHALRAELGDGVLDTPLGDDLRRASSALFSARMRMEEIVSPCSDDPNAPLPGESTMQHAYRMHERAALGGV